MLCVDFGGYNIKETPFSHALLPESIPSWPCPSPSGVSSSSYVSPFPTQIACQRRHSGHLASVLSGTEGSFLASLVSNNLNTQSDVWIGLHDPTEVHLFLYTLLLPKMLWPLSFPLHLPPPPVPIPFASSENTQEIPGTQVITGESEGLEGS